MPAQAIIACPSDNPTVELYVPGVNLRAGESLDMECVLGSAYSGLPTIPILLYVPEASRVSMLSAGLLFLIVVARCKR